MSGSAGTAAAQHAGMGQSSGGGSVTVQRLDQGAWTVLAFIPRLKNATISDVQESTVGECVYRVLTNVP